MKQEILLPQDAILLAFRSHNTPKIIAAHDEDEDFEDEDFEDEDFDDYGTTMMRTTSKIWKTSKTLKT